VQSLSGVIVALAAAARLRSGPLFSRPPASAVAVAVIILVALAEPAAADDAKTPPCSTPVAVTLADRPGTGRTTSTGGSPCVVVPGEIVLETGVRRQTTTGDRYGVTLFSSPLTFMRVGVAKRFELAVAPPSRESRATSGPAPVDSARGATDIVVAAKYLALDTVFAQASVGAAYTPPTGTGGFSAGAPSYSLAANVGLTINAKLSFVMSHVLGTAIGNDPLGQSRSYFVYAPSFTLAYALDGTTTVLVQDALLSRQGPVLPAGSRGFIALQRQVGPRLALDLDYEINLAPTSNRIRTDLGV